MTGKNAHFRLMTYNIGGGRTGLRPNLDDVTRMIQEADPDILGLQEATGWIDAGQEPHLLAEDIAKQIGHFRGVYYGPTVSMRENFHVGRNLFVDAAFNDYLDWSQGNALLSRWSFSRLSDTSTVGTPQNISIFQPIQYEGNRDTDPRKAILARIKDDNVSPYVIATHLSVLVGEREGQPEETASSTEKAIAMRLQQVRNLLHLIRERLLDRRELVFLMGDFNAADSEISVIELTQSGFVHLTPTNNQTPTHSSGAEKPIDHILIYPASRLVQYDCRIIDTPLAQKASDHLPVVADILIKPH